MRKVTIQQEKSQHKHSNFERANVFFVKFASILLLFIMGCKEPIVPEEPEIEPARKTIVEGARMSWDYSSRIKIAPQLKEEGYHGYARIIELKDNRLACVYESPVGDVEITYSVNLGASWTDPQKLFYAANNVRMATPEIIQLEDGTILVACNPRPSKPYSLDRKFAIRVKRSTDNGETWINERIIYQARHIFSDGCWEPSFLQLPNKEVLLFFSNEAIYKFSSEQNISIFRSFDSGASWSENPEIISFRNGKRDGMPVALLLENEILVSIEDNANGQFKPTILRENLSQNWKDGTITANDVRREYHPLVNKLEKEVYAGAPYITRAATGDVLLSYQSNENRDGNWELSTMVVEVGSREGRNFKNKSEPFRVSLERSAMWNSITALSDSSIIAVTSTNAFATNAVEVWMIKGYLIPEVKISKDIAKIDGELNDLCWKSKYPYFMGHLTKNSIQANLCADNDNLYVALKANKKDNTASIENFTFYIDAERKGYEAPHKGVYAFIISKDGSLSVKEGSSSKWKNISQLNGMSFKSAIKSKAYTAELSIPLASLNLSNISKSNPIGINISIENKQFNGKIIRESMSTNVVNKPYTWSNAYFNN